MLARSSKVQLGRLPSHILELMSTSQNITNVALCFWINLDRSDVLVLLTQNMLGPTCTVLLL